MAVLLLACATTACASESPSTQNPDSHVSDADPSDASQSLQGEDEYAFGADRGEIAVAIDAAFAQQNGAARWEGDTLVLAVDGDATATMAGFTQCRVLEELLREDDASVIEFPNGQVPCADVLPAG